MIQSYQIEEVDILSNKIIAYKDKFVKRKRNRNGDVYLNKDNMNNIDELARQERLEYFRKWRENNKDKVKMHNANYWKNRAKKRISNNEG